MLTLARINQSLDYNPSTGVFIRKSSQLNSKKFNTRYGNKEAGSIRPNGYRIISIDDNPYRAHRLAWIITHGDWPLQIDHINGIRDDNRIINLRSVNNQENGKNQKLKSTNTSGITGVTWHKAGGKWHSQITVNAKNISLGLYCNFFDACCARRSADLKYKFHANHGRGK